MKSKLFSCLTILLLFACKKKAENVVLPATVQPEVENNNFIVAHVNSERRTITPIANTYTYLLGYGYDINGRYADTMSSRDQVIDMRKFEAKYDRRIIIEGMYQSGTPDLIVASNAEVFSELLSKRLDETVALHSFKHSITSLPDSGALSKKYSYAWAMYYVYQKRMRLATPPTDSLKDCLSTAFTLDVNNMSPGDLVRKYGTHVLQNIKMGSKLELTYQAESNKEDKETKALIGLSRGSVAVFGLNTGRFFSGSAYINSNTNQTIYYRTAGGNAADLPSFPADYSVNPKIDFSNWFRNATPENSSMIDISRAGLISLSDLVFDPAKKAAVKSYIDTYIVTNRVRVTD